MRQLPGASHHGNSQVTSLSSDLSLITLSHQHYLPLPSLSSPVRYSNSRL